ncbi:ATP-dependent Clp protease ATP-binding subunit, partial [Limosilactobacillus reuteri]
GSCKVAWKGCMCASLNVVRYLYERRYNVKLPDDVLQAAVDYSFQDMPKRALPDKAIDLIDMTASHLAAKHPERDAKAIEKDIEAEEKKQKAAAKKEDYKAAQDAKEKIADLKKQLSENSESEKVTATPEDVAKAVEQMTGNQVS